MQVKKLSKNKWIKNVTNKGITYTDEFKIKLAKEKLNLSNSMLHRSINEGFSGGEKKKNEVLQLKMLKPKFIILDELDSGLDIDSLNIVCANINFSGAVIDYYCNVINYSTNNVVINVYHNESNTVSKIYNHGVNVLDNKLDFLINGIVPKGMVQCICNQENQIINIRNGKSTICPNLLIECFDVNSSHSAYIGRFNLEKIFYLESR